MKEKIMKVAVVGFGNLGKGVVNVIKNSPNLVISSLYTRRKEEVEKAFKEAPVFNTDVVKRDKKLFEEADVAILCGGVKELCWQVPLFAGIVSTIDSYDNHETIEDHRQRVSEETKKNKTVSIVSAGWDPGLFSMMRILFSSVFPSVSPCTFWGKGVSQGHSQAARNVNGVKDARQYTIPMKASLNLLREGNNPGLSKRNSHRRLVYVVLKEGANTEKIREEISSIPDYYEPYETEVIFITEEEMRREHSSFPHGGHVISSEKEDSGLNLGEFQLRIRDNPSFTAQILVACARGAIRMKDNGNVGAFTMLDLPIKYLSPLNWKEILKSNFL